MSDGDEGAFDMAICWKTDRFARNRYDSAVYKKRLRDNGIEILYAAESNEEGAKGIIIEGLMEALAEYYSAELAEKMRRGMRESALKGQAINRCRSLGLTTDENKKYVIDEKTAPTVRFIFEHYAAGESSTSIVDQLNAKGLRTSQGNPFNKCSIPRIIQNEMYRGVYTSKAYNVRIEGAIPAIIDDDLWKRAQAMMKTNRQLKAKYEPKAEYLLSGKLFCAKCGCTMKGVSGHSGGNGEVYRYYACSNPQCRKRNIPKDDLEGKVIRSICDHLLQSEAMELLAETMVEVQKADMEKPNAERDVLEQELRDVRRRSKNIMDAIETGSANPQLVARLDDLTQQENTLTYQLSTMEAEKPLLFTKEQYLFLLQQFYAQPTEQDDAYKRRLINTFVTNIEVSDSELLIYFNISEETENKNKNASQLNFDKSSSTEKRLVRHDLVDLVLDLIGIDHGILCVVIVPVFGADLMVVDQTVRVSAILVVGGGMEQNIQPTALTGGDRDYRDAQHLRQTVQVDLHVPLFYNVHHVQSQHHWLAQLQQLQGQIETAFQRGGIRHIDDDIHLIAEDKLPGDGFLHGIGGQAVGAG